MKSILTYDINNTESKRDLLEELERHVLAAKDYFESEFKPKWEENVEYHKGNQIKYLHTCNNPVVTNYVYRNNDTICNELLGENIMINTKAKRPQFRENEKYVRLAAFYAWEDEEMGIRDRVEESVSDMVSVARGVAKTTVLFEEEEEEIYVEELENRPVIKQGKKIINKIKGKKEDPMRKKKKKVYRVLEDRILVESISPFDVYVEYGNDGRNGYGGLNMIIQKRRWAKDKFEKIVGKDRIKNFGSSLKEIKMTKSGVYNKGEYAGKQKIKAYEGYEIWVKDSNTKYGYAKAIVPDCFTDFISNPMASGLVMGHPFIFCDSHKVSGEPYPRGKTQYYIQNQNEYNMHTSLIMSYAKEAMPKYLYDANTLDRTTIEKLVAGEELSFIPVEELEEKDLRELIHPIVQPNIPSEVHVAKNMARVHIDEVAGITNTFAGGGKSLEDRATLGVLQNQGSARRLARDKRNVNKFIGKVLKNTIQLMQQFLSDDMWINIVGREAEDYQKITKKQLEGDISLTARVISAEEVRERTAMLGIIKGMPQSIQPDMVTGEYVNVLKFLKRSFDMSPHLKGDSDVIERTGDPVDEYRRMLEGEVVKPRKGENHMEHMAQHLKQIEDAKSKKVDKQIIDILEYHYRETTTLNQQESEEKMKAMIAGGGQSPSPATNEGFQPVAPKGMPSEAKALPGQSPTEEVPTAQINQPQ